MRCLLAATVTLALASAAHGEAPNRSTSAATCAQPSRAPARQLCSAPGYVELITPYLQSDGFPQPAEEPAWRAGMAPFVPCIAAQLEKGEPCVRRAALILLMTIADEQAVAALMARLEDPTEVPEMRESVLWVLAQTFQSPLVVPHVVEALQVLQSPDRALGLALASVVDARILDALLQVGEREPARIGEDHYVSAVGRHTRARPDDPRLDTLFWQAMATPEGRWAAHDFAKVVCDARDFERLAATYLDDHVDDCQHMWLFGFLMQLGGDGWPRFLERALTGAKDPLCRRRYADELVAQVCGRAEGTPTDVEQALSCLRELPAALPYLSTRSLWKVISSPELVTAPAAHRAAFWGQAELLFHDNPDLAWLAACNLSHALGLDGTGELDTALAALERCYAAGPGGRGERQSYEEKRDRLTWLIANRQIAASVRLDGVTPVPTGLPALSLVATLHGPDDTLERLLKQSPRAYVDRYRGTALSATCEVSVRPQRRGTDQRALLLLPTEPACTTTDGVTGLRARLLFLGAEDDGFRGTIDSGVMPMAPDANTSGPS